MKWRLRWRKQERPGRKILSLLKVTRWRCPAVHSSARVSIQPSINCASLFACSFLSRSDWMKKDLYSLNEKQEINKGNKTACRTESLWQSEELININELCWMTVMVMTVHHKPAAASPLRVFRLISHLHLHCVVTLCGIWLWDRSSPLFCLLRNLQRWQNGKLRDSCLSFSISFCLWYVVERQVHPFLMFDPRPSISR